MTKINRVLVVATMVMMAVAFMGCDTGITSDYSNSQIKLTADGGASRSASRSVAGAADGTGIDGLIFSKIEGRAYAWSGAAQVMDVASSWEVGNSSTAFYSAGGTLFDPTATFVDTIDDSQVPQTVDMITFEMSWPTVVVNEKTYGQANAVPYDRNMATELEYMNHQAAVRIVETTKDVDGNITDVDVKYGTNGSSETVFDSNIVVFVNPAVLDNFSTEINGKVVGPSPFTMVNFDGSAVDKNNEVQLLIAELETLIEMRECYMTIIPMTPSTPWADDEVTITLGSDFSTLLAEIWTAGDDEFDNFTNGTASVPVYNWDGIGYVNSEIDSVVDFEINSDTGMALDWSITIE